MNRNKQTHVFSEVPRAEIQRSSFDRSHGVKTTFDSSFLIPVFVDEALPGDTFNVRMTAMARLATPIKPIMDNLYLDSFFFAVPYRLLWDNWEKFNGAQTDPGDSIDFEIPQVHNGATVLPVGSLYDYMGLPTGITNLEFSQLPLRAYVAIWNQWFRDQNLQDSIPELTNDAVVTDLTKFPLLFRGKRHDYFTSCLPWPQKGDAVSIPLGSYADVISDLGISGGDGIPTFQNTINFGGLVTGVFSTPDKTVNRQLGGSTAAVNEIMKWNNPSLVADLSTATAVTINALREAFQVQRLLERDARGGTRYTEVIRSHFGVTSPDARMQRPEYLGGGTSYVNISPVAQTAQTDLAPDTTPQGNLAAIGTASLNGHGFSKSFTEHCVVIGLVCARADLTYQQGLNRMWSRSTRYDFYWPALAHLGEQAVLNKEIYAQGTSADEETFGYQERYAEYRYKPSQITGKFRSTYATTLDIWHLADKFASLPTLNNIFIQDSAYNTVDRVIAVPSEPHFLFDAWFNFRAARPMPLYGVPGLIDHF
ncbi:MAG: major capsid protein [Microviridae sp.]|nr:MAG: major capsid protein [Microviridae sp.]